MVMYWGRFCMLETDGRICLAYQQNKKSVISEKFVRSVKMKQYFKIVAIILYTFPSSKARDSC